MHIDHTPTAASIKNVDRQIDVNLRAVIHMTEAFVPHMVNSNGGHIVNIASLAGKIQAPFMHACAPHLLYLTSPRPNHSTITDAPIETTRLGHQIIHLHPRTSAHIHVHPRTTASINHTPSHLHYIHIHRCLMCLPSLRLVGGVPRKRHSLVADHALFTQRPVPPAIRSMQTMPLNLGVWDSLGPRDTNSSTRSLRSLALSSAQVSCWAKVWLWI